MGPKMAPETIPKRRKLNEKSDSDVLWIFLRFGTVLGPILEPERPPKSLPRPSQNRPKIEGVWQALLKRLLDPKTPSKKTWLGNGTGSAVLFICGCTVRISAVFFLTDEVQQRIFEEQRFRSTPSQGSLEDDLQTSAAWGVYKHVGESHRFARVARCARSLAALGSAVVA